MLLVATGRAMATAFLEQGADAGNAVMERFDAASDAMRSHVEPFVKSYVGRFNDGLCRIERHQQVQPQPSEGWPPGIAGGPNGGRVRHDLQSLDHAEYFMNSANPSTRPRR